MQAISAGGTAINATISAGGMQAVADGGLASATILDGGTQNIASGGTAQQTVVNNGGTQAVEGGGVASGTKINTGGVQSIAAGGSATSTTIQNGGAQSIASGGTASYTTLETGGTQTLGTVEQPGGYSDHITMKGGTLVVNDYATAQFDTATGGTLRLLEEGLATAQLGSLDVSTGGTAFSFDNAYARGDTVRLGLGDATQAASGKYSEAGKSLVITNMDGYANFIINTDLANKKSDTIEMKSVVNTDQNANTVKINYDPTLAEGKSYSGEGVLVATVGKGTTTFKGAESEIVGLKFTPTITTTDSGQHWYITKVDRTGAGDGTHSTVMGMTAGMAALAAGTAFISDATDGLGLAANTGKDGVSVFAGFGGGSLRQDTGSHVNVNTWNAILALGHKNEKEKSAFEYGAFFEYGTGNYTTHDDDRRGDGSMKYTGGGVLAKWTANHGFYVEGSLRAGTVHDDARNVLHDDFNSYSYETDAGYFGAHLGVGKEIQTANNDTVDVYAKYFFNRRNGASFTVENQQFDLDAVTSQILRVGARYTMKREKWNFYGGVAYEHELDGEATGKVDGFAIRSADVKGGSFRAELGATMKPDKNSPWSLDLNVAGFAGKKQGFSGGVSVSFTF